RARQQVERRRRDELLPRQELAADEARVRLEQLLLRFANRVLEGNIAPEAAAEAAHQRVVEVVERPVERACRAVTRMVVDVGLVERPAAGVVEVFLAQPVP